MKHTVYISRESIKFKRSLNNIMFMEQPSSKLFSKFDRLILVAGGRTAYIGSAKHAVDFCLRLVQVQIFYKQLVTAYIGIAKHAVDFCSRLVQVQIVHLQNN